MANTEVNESDSESILSNNKENHQEKQSKTPSKAHFLSYSNSFTDYSSVDCDSLTDSSNKWSQNPNKRVYNNYNYEHYERNVDNCSLSTVKEDLNSPKHTNQENNDGKDENDDSREYHYQSVDRPKAPIVNRPITRRGRDLNESNTKDSRRNSQSSDYAELQEFTGNSKASTRPLLKVKNDEIEEELICDLPNTCKNNNLTTQKRTFFSSLNDIASKTKQNVNNPSILPRILNNQQDSLDDYVSLKPPSQPQSTNKTLQLKQSKLLTKNVWSQKCNSRLEERNIASRNTMRTNTSLSTNTRSSSVLHSRKMNPDEIQESVRRLYYVPSRNAEHPKFQTIHTRILSKHEIDALCSRLYIKQTPKCILQQSNKPTIKVLDKIAIDKLIERLISSGNGRVPDSCRIAKNSDLKNMGLIQSYAWRGY